MTFYTEEKSLLKSVEDGVADITYVPEIDDAGIATNLQVRYKRDEIYTYCGTVLIAVNPYKKVTLYEKSNIKDYIGTRLGTLPPHIFAVAECTFDNIKNNMGNQSVLISGESGAGKTECTKFILKYLTSVTQNQAWIEEQILEASTILEAFGNAKTCRNNNSSRFGKYTQICFDNHNAIVGAVIQDYLLEKQRIAFQAVGERNYHIFYQLCKASDEIKRKYIIGDLKDYRYICQKDAANLAEINDKKDFEAVLRGLSILQISQENQDQIFQCVSAVLHLGNIKFVDVDGESVGFTSEDSAVLVKIAMLLGVEKELLINALSYREIIVRGETSQIQYKLTEAQANRDSVAKGLYAMLFSMLINYINNKTNPAGKASRTIGVLDIFGFENFDHVNSLEQLCINFTNERLHRFFNDYCFNIEMNLYEKERISTDDFKWDDNQGVLDVIEKSKQCVLSYLDTTCATPGGTDEIFLKNMDDALATNKYYVKNADKKKTGVFGIKHFAGTVTYTVENFLEKNRDSNKSVLHDCLRSSSFDIVQLMSRLEEENVTQVVDSKTLSKKQFASVTSTFRGQLDQLLDSLRATTPWFVRCLKPNMERRSGNFSRELVLEQLKYTGMLDLLQIRKNGFPCKVKVKDFLEKYRCLAPKDLASQHSEDREACIAVMNLLNLPKQDWQCGRTMLFFRQKCFDPLEDMRRKRILWAATMCQKVWRSYSLRKEFLRIKALTITMQHRARGFLLRRRYLRKLRAVVVLQAFARACAAKKVYRRLVAEKLAKEAAARAAYLEKLRLEGEERERLALEKAEKERLDAQMAVDDIDKVLNECLSQLDCALLKEQEKEEQVKSLNDQLNAASSEDEKDAIQQQLSVLLQEFEGAKAERANLETEYSETAEEAKVLKDASDAAESAFKNVQENLTANVRVENETIEDAKRDFIFLTYAAKFFNQQFTAQNTPISNPELVAFTRAKTMSRSLTKLEDPSHEKRAKEIWQEIQIYLSLSGGVAKDKEENKLFSLVELLQSTGIQVPGLRDEIYMQVCRQCNTFMNTSKTQDAQTRLPKPAKVRRAWALLQFLTICFSPSNNLYKHVAAFVEEYSAMKLYPVVPEDTIPNVAQWCSDALKQTKMHGCRKYSISRQEFNSIITDSSLPLPVAFLGDVNIEGALSKEAGSMHELILGTENEHIVGARFSLFDLGRAQSRYDGICSMTFGKILEIIGKVLRIRMVSGWGVFEHEGADLKSLKSLEYVGDLLKEWEVRQAIKKTTNNPDLLFQKRIFKQRDVIEHGDARSKYPIEVNLLYCQVKQSLLREVFPVDLRAALTLAGLTARIRLGPHEDSMLVNENQYGSLEEYLPPSIINNVTLASKRSRQDWMILISKRHREIGDKYESVAEAQAEFLSVVTQNDLSRSSFYRVKYCGHWCFPLEIDLAINESGFLFLHKISKDKLRVYTWDNLESITVQSGQDLARSACKEYRPADFIHRITFTLERPPDPTHVTGKREEQIEFTFETPQAMQIASLIGSYSPHQRHTQWAMVKETELLTVKSRKTGNAERYAAFREVLQARLNLVNNCVIKPLPMSGRPSGFIANSIRALSPTLRKLKTDALASNTMAFGSGQHKYTLQEMEQVFPIEFWAFSKNRITQPISVMDNEERSLEHEDSSHRLFTSIMVYQGLAPNGGFFVDDDANFHRMVQGCISECLKSKELTDEFFLQLIKQTSDNPKPNSDVNIKAWQLLAITLNCVVPNNVFILSYLKSHLKFRAAEERLESKYAKYCQTSLIYTSQRGRKNPPSRSEQIYVANLSKLIVRVHFLDNVYQAYYIDPWSTVRELVVQIQSKLGLSRSLTHYNLNENFLGSKYMTELNPDDTIADSLFRWEKLLRPSVVDEVLLNDTLNRTRTVKRKQILAPRPTSSDSNSEMVMTFKRSNRVTQLLCPNNEVEQHLYLHQGIYDVSNGWFPLNSENTRLMGSLVCQMVIGDYDQSKVGSSAYVETLGRFFPPEQAEENEFLDDVVELHEMNKGMSLKEAELAFLRICLKWEYYGSAIFVVHQTVSTDIPKEFWLTVNHNGIGFFKINSEKPIFFFNYSRIVNINPSQKNLILQTDSIQDGAKYLINTPQALEIAELAKHFLEGASGAVVYPKTPLRKKADLNKPEVSVTDEDETTDDVEPPKTKTLEEEKEERMRSFSNARNIAKQIVLDDIKQKQMDRKKTLLKKKKSAANLAHLSEQLYNVIPTSEELEDLSSVRDTTTRAIEQDMEVEQSALEDNINRRLRSSKEEAEVDIELKDELFNISQHVPRHEEENVQDQESDQEASGFNRAPSFKKILPDNVFAQLKSNGHVQGVDLSDERSATTQEEMRAADARFEHARKNKSSNQEASLSPNGEDTQANKKPPVSPKPKAGNAHQYGDVILALKKNQAQPGNTTVDEIVPGKSSGPSNTVNSSISSVPRNTYAPTTKEVFNTKETGVDAEDLRSHITPSDDIIDESGEIFFL